MIRQVTTCGPFKHGITRDFKRADLEFYSVDHFRPTFDVWVFFNDPDITDALDDPKRPSLAGTFAVFGHSECWGTGGGHCKSVPTARRFDLRPSHPMTPAFRRIIVTASVRRAQKFGDELTVTLVASTREPWDHKDGAKLFDFSGIQLVTFS